MSQNRQKHLLKRLLNITVVFRYIGESVGIISQGARFRDKWLLFLYYLKIPAVIFKSLATGKQLRQLEEESKFLRGNVTLKNRYGAFYCGNNILTVYVAARDYEKHLHAHIDIPDGIFIDVGAHIGKYSIKVARNPKVKVIALEPEKFNFSLLKKNVALNGLSNIFPINKGAYSATGKIPFYISGPGEGMHSVIPQEDAWKEASIEVETLDNIVNRLPVREPIRLIKIDTEGAESEVLKGAEKILQTHHPKIVVEIWKNSASSLSFVQEHLQRFNYSCIPLDEENYLFS